MHRFRRLALWWLSAAALGIPTASALAADTRAYVGGHYALELDGVSAGSLGAVEAGVSAGVVSDFRVQAGTGTAPAFYDWITASWDGKGARKSGSVVTVAYDSQILVRRDFAKALITGTRLPALDAASKDAAWVVVDFAPEGVTVRKGAGSTPAPPKIQRPWTVNSFRLEIAGLDCSRVHKVESFTFKQGIKGSQTRGPTAIAFSDLVVTLFSNSAASWQSWHDSGGQNADSQKKSGDLVFLGQDMKTEITRVHFSGLGLKSLTPVATRSASQIPSLVATMSCEHASFAWKGGAGFVVNVPTGGN